ncbi:MAG TPA: glycine--tRNA ligase, partial [archaeon]|nr:glycine--tRNA ligase [archaeon]
MEADKIFDVARRRGFFFPASEIYGGFSGFYDYGTTGTLLKRKIESEWKRFFLGLSPNFFEIETSNIMPEKV